MMNKEYTVLLKESKTCWRLALEKFSTLADAKAHIRSTPRNSYESAKVMVRDVSDWRECKD